MRYGATISAFMHTIIIVLIVVGLPSILQSERRSATPIAVEIVSLNAMTKKSGPKETALRKLPQRSSAPKPVSRIQNQPPKPSVRPRVKPKHVPKAKVEQLPIPKPKRKRKATPPKPRPKPQRLEVAVKKSVPPRPKLKPRPPKDEFQSLLKNLAKEQKEQKAAPKQKLDQMVKRKEREHRRSPIEKRRISAGLVAAITQQITPCWKIQAGAKDAANMRVAIRMRLNPDGSLGALPKIQDRERMKKEPFFRAVAESALRALRDPSCVPIKLPYEYYDMWKEIVFTFDPREALAQ